MQAAPARTRSIAVIGSGISGLTAAYVLSRHSRVTVFEADARLGGHAHTHAVDAEDGTTVGVDSAFLVYTERTYPTLCRLFDELDVASTETDMSIPRHLLMPLRSGDSTMPPARLRRRWESHA